MPKPPVFLTPLQLARVATLYSHGTGTTEIAKAFNVSGYHLTHRIYPKLGIKPRMGRPKERFIEYVSE